MLDFTRRAEKKRAGLPCGTGQILKHFPHTKSWELSNTRKCQDVTDTRAKTAYHLTEATQLDLLTVSVLRDAFTCTQVTQLLLASRGNLIPAASLKTLAP